MASLRYWLRSHPTIAHLLVLLALWLLFFGRYFAPAPNGVTFPDGDFTQQFFIFRDIAYRQLVAGQLPLWANCFFGGYPFHADPQSQLFYPPVLLSFGVLRLLGYGHFPLLALTFEAIAHYLAVSVFAYLFLREETGSRAGALAGAVVFAYGGYLTGYPPLQTGILETVTWLPLALLALRRFAAHGSGRAAAGAVGALAVAFFAGHPQTFLFTAYLCAAYFTFRARRAGLKWISLAARGALVFGLVALVAAVQLLPQAQFLALSTRAALPYDELAAGLPIGDVAQLFVTQLVSRWHPLFIGIVGLTLAVLALRLRVRAGATVYFWLAAAAAGLLLSFGGGAPLYRLAYWLLPGYRLFRGQERAALIFAFAAAVLVAVGAAALSHELGDRRRAALRDALRWLRNLTPLAVALLIGSVFLAQSGLGDWGHLPARFGLLFGGLVLAVGLLAARVRYGAQWRWHTPLLIGFVGLELFSANLQTNAVAPFEAYPRLALLDPIQVDAASGRWFRVQDDARMQGHWACGYGLAEWGGISPIRLQTWTDFEDQAPELVRWALLGVDYVISWKQDLITREGVQLPVEVAAEGAAPLGEAKVYHLARAPQRAWLLGDPSARPSPFGDSQGSSVAGQAVTTVDSQAELWALLREPGFDPFTRAVVQSGSVETEPGAAGTVRVLADRPGLLELAVQSERDALLVVSEAWYPGWTAETGSGRAPAALVDGFAQGYAVAGAEREQVIRVEYNPPLLRWGAAVSLVGVVATLLLALRRRQL